MEILNNVPGPVTRNAAGGVEGASMVEAAGLCDDRMVGSDVRRSGVGAAGDQAVADMADGGCDASGSVICGAVAGCQLVLTTILVCSSKQPP